MKTNGKKKNVFFTAHFFTGPMALHFKDDL
jgi:hypothetical protein